MKPLTEPPRVLLIEDALPVLDHLTCALEAYCPTVPLSSLSSALDYLEKRPRPGAIITRRWMHGRDVLPLVVAAVERDPDLPVLVTCTATCLRRRASGRSVEILRSWDEQRDATL